MEMTSHHLCHILLVGSKSQVTHTQEHEHRQEHEETQITEALCLTVKLKLPLFGAL